MILSVSRRTDIPNYYSEWFFNRIREGFFYVKNPMNPHQISRVNISPEVVDCIVFWTKNPYNMMDRLDELADYPYYFQFTLTGYGRDMEPNIPDKRDVLIPVFQQLSGKLGKERVIWRYDPILLNERYTMAYHLKAFREIADNLAGYTEKVIISFVDFYTKMRRNTAGQNIRQITDQEMLEAAGEIALLAKERGLVVESCAEHVDLRSVGIEHGCCIDKKLIERMIGYKLNGSKDRNQRPECGCLESVDVGTYNTCKNGCRYCYANFNHTLVKRGTELYDPESPLLCGVVGEKDKITERNVKSLKKSLISL